MAQQKTPKWLVVTLAVVLLIFVGPPLLGLALGAVGLALALGGLLLKVALVAFAVYAVVMLLRGVFGGGAPTSSLPATAGGGSIDLIQAEYEQTDREKLAELDRELDRAIREKNAGPHSS